MLARSGSFSRMPRRHPQGRFPIFRERPLPPMTCGPCPSIAKSNYLEVSLSMRVRESTRQRPSYRHALYGPPKGLRTISRRIFLAVSTKSSLKKGELCHIWSSPQ